MSDSFDELRRTILDNDRSIVDGPLSSDGLARLIDALLALTKDELGGT